MTENLDVSTPIASERNDGLYDSQRIRDLKLVIEYKDCAQYAPSGIYIVPSADDIRSFHGVIFLRRGLYRGGVYRFQIKLPLDYNSRGSYPHITFLTHLFNPFVDSSSGVLDLQQDPLFADWQPQKHFLNTCLTMIKKIFYIKSYDEYTKLSNEEARNIFNTDKETFLQLVNENVENSISHVLDQTDEDCSLLFTEPKPEHDLIRNRLITSRIKDENPSNQ